MKQEWTVAEISDHLDKIPKFSKEKHTLDTLKKMLGILGNPQKGRKIVHIAGTNGKGSVCAFLSSVLREAGHTTAVFTSPHLLSVKERFSFDGKEADDSQFIRAFLQVSDHLADFEQAQLGHPSYFEFLFLMFLLMAEERPDDWLILETGLGGRLDATNVVEEPAVTVITSISLDHMEYLGDTVEKIAGEKAGILKKGCPVIYDSTNRKAARVIQNKADQNHCPCYPVDETSYRQLSLEGGRLSLTGSVLNGQGELLLDIPFAAEYQAVNAMLAVRAAELLSVPLDIIKKGISCAVWPGRMEQIQKDVYLDGAHNEGGIREFSKAAREIAAQKKGRRILLFAVVSDKEYEDMARILCREFEPDVLILTQIHSSRGLDIGKLSRAAKDAWEKVDQEKSGEDNGGKSHDIRVITPVETAFDAALEEKKQEDTVFCAGSLYLIGEIKQIIRRKQDEQ